MTNTPIAILKIVRDFEAPRQAVFEAFASYEAMHSWFGPAECQTVKGEVDFRVGGEYRIDMQTPGGIMTVAGRYTEISAPEKIAFTWKWLEDEDWTDMDSQVVIEFKDKGDSTEMHFIQTGFPSDESRGNHEHGWCGSFDKLGKM
jgi:uncharacterized protein YndB with AHSA1/START domain